MPFNFLGTMRAAQWQSFRNWVLNERRNVSSRVAVINAELARIGVITVFYRRRNDVVQTQAGSVREIETVTEERARFTVSSGSSLEKLVQAYVAQGGNPMSISLWLQPDNVQWTTDEDPLEDPEDDPNEFATDIGFQSVPFDQPYGGVLSTTSTDSYGPGGQYPGGISVKLTDLTRIAGRYVEEGSAGAKPAIKTDWARRWVRQELSELARLEENIVKLMDLREQLLEERDWLIQQSVGGTVQDFPLAPDDDQFARNLHLTELVTQMDRTFYEMDENGEPDFSRINRGTRADGTSLSDPTQDIQGEGSQVTPSGISLYDTLLDDPEGTDPYAV